MKKILITGISSFIGYHLAKYFSGLSYEVTGTVSKKLREYEQRSIQAKRLNNLKEVNIFKLDMRDNQSLKNTIQDVKPDYCIHHAGYTQNYGSFEYDIDQAFEINVRPLYALYKELTDVGCKGVIITGTNAEYSDCDLANMENDNCMPTTPYGLSKLNETLSAYQLSKFFNLPTRISRVYIPFGAMDSPNKLFPYLINLLKQNRTVDLSPGLQKRDFIYIKELVRIYFSLLLDLETGNFEIFNACSGAPIRLKDFICLICEKLGKETKLLDFNARQMRPREPRISYGNTNKLSTMLNYQFNYSLENAIEDYLNEEK